MAKFGTDICKLRPRIVPNVFPKVTIVKLNNITTPYNNPGTLRSEMYYVHYANVAWEGSLGEVFLDQASVSLGLPKSTTEPAYFL